MCVCRCHGSAHTQVLPCEAVLGTPMRAVRIRADHLECALHTVHATACLNASLRTPCEMSVRCVLRTAGMPLAWRDRLARLRIDPVATGCATPVSSAWWCRPDIMGIEQSRPGGNLVDPVAVCVPIVRAASVLSMRVAYGTCTVCERTPHSLTVHGVHAREAAADVALLQCVSTYRN